MSKFKPLAFEHSYVADNTYQGLALARDRAPLCDLPRTTFNHTGGAILAVVEAVGVFVLDRQKMPMHPSDNGHPKIGDPPKRTLSIA